MSIRSFSGLLGLGLLVGCASPEVDVSRIAPDTLPLARGVVVAGPPGYCVDPSSLRQTEDAAFVILGSCAALSEGRKPIVPEHLGVLTIVVSQPGAGSVLSTASAEDLAAFFESDAGQGALALDGQTGTVELLETRVEAGRVFVRARDLSGERPGGLDPEYWRAMVDVRSHLVTATLIGFEGQPLEPGAGLRTMSQLAERLIRENPPSLDQ